MASRRQPIRTSTTEDFRNAAAAFLAKKTPIFEGR